MIIYDSHGINKPEVNTNDVLIEDTWSTCDVIYEKYRKKKLEGKLRPRIVFLISTFICLSAIITIALFQYDEYFAYVNDRFEYINSTKSFCQNFGISNIDIISTPIAAFLIILYTLLYKRRVFLRNKYKYRNIGLPMITSCWNKTDRLFSSFVFGLIALNVFEVVKNSLAFKNNVKLIPVKDPSGLLGLLVKIIEMFLIGIRYYPLLVAYRTNTFFINFTSAIYVWIDFIENIYVNGKCDSITKEDHNDRAELEHKLWYFIVYKIFFSIPFSIFSSFILVSLTYRSFINLVDFLFSYKSIRKLNLINKKNKDSFFCSICHFDDENEIIYSAYDLIYVINLLNSGIESKKIDYISDEDENEDISHPIKQKYISNYCSLKYEKKESKLLNFIQNHIYKWDSTFRFTSRFINTITVALVALYYFFIFLTYNLAVKVSYKLLKIQDLNNNNINISGIVCNLIDYCDLENFELPVPDDKIELLKSLKTSISSIFIVPIFVSLVLSLLQLGYLIKDSKTHIVELNKGQCEFVRKAKNLNKAAIASSSFHFGGYVVGYLIWGYFIIYICGVIVGLVILSLRFVSDDLFGKIALKLVPVVTVLLVKLIVNKVFSSYIFLYKESKILALANFRAFNVFLYFNFYFDTFMGFLSAIIRLIKAFFLAIFMMPRISYSFMGRHFERMDNGYSCYSGFLHMEASSILYYKELGIFIRRFRIEKFALLKKLKNKDVSINLKKFNGRLPAEEVYLEIEKVKPLKMKPYNKMIVNRWYLYLRLSLNRELVIYRKKYIEMKKTKNKKPTLDLPSETFISKVKHCFQKSECNKNNKITSCQM